MRIYDHNLRRTDILMIGILGGFLFLSGVILSPQTAPVHAQESGEASYVGARECRSCHREMSRDHAESPHGLTLRRVDGDPTGILADFSQSETIPQIRFDDGAESRPLQIEDISYVVGSGRDVQRYLYEMDNSLLVLPVEWNVVAQTWEPYTLADDWPNPAYDWSQNCAGCHTSGFEIEGRDWIDDGVQCESCHGPGSLHVEAADDAGSRMSDDELHNIRASITYSPDPQICGQCHSRGHEPDNDLPYPISYRPGEMLLDDTTFSLVTADDTEYWWQSGHGRQQNMQFNEWLQSGHARSLDSLLISEQAEESCLHCHSGDYRWTEQIRADYEAGALEGTLPDAVTLQTAQYGVTCTTCHTLHGDTESDVQIVDEPYALCTNCHGDINRIEEVHHPVEEMYEGISIVENLGSSSSTHFIEGVECVTCHMAPVLQSGDTWYASSHTMAPVFPGETEGDQPDSCTDCHSDLSRGFMQQFIEDTQSGVLERLRMTKAEAAIEPNTPDWVATVLEFISRDGSLGVHNFAYTSTLLDAAEVELGITIGDVPSTIPVAEIEDPLDCAECHMDAYRRWQTSPHANASLSQEFQALFAEDGRPSYCMGCHASGYDSRAENYVFEGVVCSNCHYKLIEAEHPPGPMEVANDSDVCGRCHSGQHAPTYDEWLVSSHSTVGIDCADCHTAHDNGLKEGDVNSTCGTCHEEAVVDEIHMGEEMTCVDCHMTRRTHENGIRVFQTGHSMGIDPGTCAECHGNTHLLSSGNTMLLDQQVDQLEVLEDEVAALQETATENLNSGVVGGAIGALVMVGIAFLIVRLGRLR